MRTATLYVTGPTARDCGTAAQLAGMDSGDAWAEMTLRRALDAMPEVAELKSKIAYAIKATQDKFYQTRNTPPQPEP